MTTVYGLGSVIEATFQPSRTDNLSDLAPPVGWRGHWGYCWVAKPDEAYAGQTIWSPHRREDRYGWAPFEDLTDIVDIPWYSPSEVQP